MKLAADANVLLSAILGGRARLILTSLRVEEILTTQATLAEVHEYAGILAGKKRLSEDLLLLAIASLPVTVVEPTVYADSLTEAKRRIGRGDPEGAELLALAIHFRIAVWSNDKDFEGSGIECYTTEHLLRKLEML